VVLDGPQHRQIDQAKIGGEQSKPVSRVKRSDRGFRDSFKHRFSSMVGRR
jgi:hypothetical protein